MTWQKEGPQALGGRFAGRNQSKASVAYPHPFAKQLREDSGFVFKCMFGPRWRERLGDDPAPPGTETRIAHLELKVEQLDRQVHALSASSAKAPALNRPKWDAKDEADDHRGPTPPSPAITSQRAGRRRP